MNTTNPANWNKALRITLHTVSWLLRAIFKIILLIGSFFLALYFGTRSGSSKNNENPSYDIEDRSFVGDDRSGLFSPKNFSNHDDTNG